MGTEQQFCLKWNNHRSTLFSVFDNLLEEESLVDVTLSADGQFLRAHRVILSACSPYFRNLFRSSLLSDKHPVVFMKDVDFENLKSLVEYMYKGEANVPQHMLTSFIRTAESLQIRGLAECATKQLESETGLSNISSSKQNVKDAKDAKDTSTGNQNPFHKREEKKKRDRVPNSIPSPSPSAPSAVAVTTADQAAAIASGAGGILAAHLAKTNHPLFDFPPEMLLGRPPPLGLQLPPSGSHFTPPPMKKPRKSNEPKQNQMQNHFAAAAFMGNLPMPLPIPIGKSMVPSPGRVSGPVSSPRNAEKRDKESTNNNYESGDEGVLKIDEDPANEKENREDDHGRGRSPRVSDHFRPNADFEASNGISTEEEEDEEEQPMPAPGPDMSGSAAGIVNPWTGEPIQLSEYQEDKSALVEGFLDQSLRAIELNKSFNSNGNDTTVNDNTVNDSTNMGGGSASKYACVRCGRSYLHQATLVRHQRYECGISASYPCPMCGRKFKRRDVLKGHMEKCANKSTQAAQAAAAQVAAAAAAVAVAASSGPSLSISPFTSLPAPLPTPSTMPNLAISSIAGSGSGSPFASPPASLANSFFLGPKEFENNPIN